jgi:flagellar biosynthesis protein FlhF
MQVKKFEAPTIQEALENVKRELGPEAIILQTKKNKRGFGLLSKASVEVTAAISERSLQKKQSLDTRLPENSRAAMKNMPAERQAQLIDRYTDKTLTQASQTRDQVSLGSSTSPTPASKRITATRYIDIEDDFKAAHQPMPPKAAVKLPPVETAQPLPPAISARNVHALEDEIRDLKKMIEDLKTTTESQRQIQNGGGVFGKTGEDSPLLQELFEQLVMHGIERRYAYELVKKVSFEIGQNTSQWNQSEEVLDLLADEIMKSVEVSSIFKSFDTDESQQQGPLVIALIGPTGAGKTTTIAKIASEALSKRRLKVGLINLDHQKIVAFEQLGTYAKILNVPFRSALSGDDFKAALLDFHGLDVIFVDTAGCSQKNPASMKETREILQLAPHLKIYTVLSATTREAELYDAANRFSYVRPQGIIISKLDEATVYGSIYNVSQKVKLPLIYFTTGQRIPEDIEEATRERIVSLVMDL